MDYLKWIVSPVCGAIIGYFTNWLAIKMLFRPYNEIKFMGIRLPFTPGLIPKERKTLAKKVAETLSGNVLTPEVLNNSLNSDETVSKISDLVSSSVDKLLKSECTVLQLFGEQTVENILEKLKSEKVYLTAAEKIPVVFAGLRKFIDENKELDNRLRTLVKNIASENFGRIIGIFVNYDSIYDNIKNSLFEYIEKEENQKTLLIHVLNFADKLIVTEKSFILDKKVGEIASIIPEEAVSAAKEKLGSLVRVGIEKGGMAVAEALNIAEVVENKINEFDLPEAESIIISVTQKQLRMITVLGGILGFIIGFLPLLFELL